MALHSGERKRQVPEEAAVAADPIPRNVEENEDWRHDLVEHSRDLLCVHDLEGRILAVNPVPALLLGYSVEEMLRKRLQDLVDPQFRDQCEAYLHEVERTGESQGLMAVLTRAGERRIWEYHNTLRTEGMATPIVRGIAHDVTERVRAEKALRESAARERARAKELETVLEVAPVPICIAHDAECRRMTGNRAAHEQLRVPAGKNISKSAPPGERPSFRVMEDGLEIPVDLLPIQQAAATGKPVYGRPLTIVFEDGSKRETITNVVPLLDEEGKPRGAVGASIDLTEQKQAEKNLRASELRFRQATRASHIGIFDHDHLTDTIYWSPEHREIYGFGADEVVTLSVYLDHVYAADREAMAAAVRRAHDPVGDGLFDVEHRIVRRDGDIRWLTTRSQTSFEGEGDARHKVRTVGAVLDITEHRQAEQALRETTEALREAKKKLTEEKLYLEQEINTELGFGEIIGQSKALEAVMEQVGKVAPSDATVLLLGETGAGKELVARAIHWLSLRTGNSFIKMNCAAIPSGLVESELFGHEKGAFTGALSKKIGRLELADKGTLFLDEIGEIPLALQPKLLRVLQDREFERLGGTRTLKVDFRLIAATNRDLNAAVQQNEFRSDLYYRLNVFPIRVPPLRERRADIRLLAEHFVQKFARRMNKSITSIPKKTMDALMGWEWPGNVRELENFIERSVILTHGSVLAAPLNEMEPNAVERKFEDQTLESAERKHILRALRESHGQIGGPKGAAMRLGLRRTTLQSKLKQLGINPQLQRPGA